VEDGLRGLMIVNSLLMTIFVLILVLVEDGLRARNRQKYLSTILKVLILVLVEDGLRDKLIVEYVERIKSLNPCFSGRWSASLDPTKVSEHSQVGS